MGYRDDFRKAFPKIRPGMEDDLEWFNEGLDLLRKRKYQKAEPRFMQLTLSQPEHPDGLEGLARTYYAMGDRAKSIVFIEDAIDMTEKMVALGQSDREVLLMLQKLRNDIERMPKTQNK